MKMKKILGLLVGLCLSVSLTTPLLSQEISNPLPRGADTRVTIETNKRYQSYESDTFGSFTSITIPLQSALGRSAGLGYVFNNATTAIQLFPNYDIDSAVTMKGITVPAGLEWNLSPANSAFDTFKIRSKTGSSLDILTVFH